MYLATAAQRLELTTIARVQGLGAGGLHTNDVVYSRLHIGIVNGEIYTTIRWELECQAIPDLEKAAVGVRYRGQPVELIGLLGRDVLRRATMIYNGKEGKLQVTFDREWLRGLPTRRQP